MAFVTPSVEDFVARYPEFLEQDYDRLSSLLAVAVSNVSSSWIEKDRLEAIFALTAHYAYKAAQQTQDFTSTLTGGAVAGPIVRESLGPASVMYQKESDSLGASGSSTPVNVTESPYWSYYESLTKRSFPAVAII